MKTLANSEDIDALWDYMDPFGSELRFDAALSQLHLESQSLLYAELLTQKARAIGLQQQYERAISLLDEAKQLIGDYYDISLVRYYLELGRVYNSSRQEGAYQCFHNSFSLAIELKEDFYAIDAAHMLAIVTKHEESLEWNLKAIEIAEKSIHSRAKNWLGSLYNNTAWTYFFSENYDMAYTIFQKSKLWYAEKKLRNEEFIAEWSLARTLRAQGHLQQALLAQLSLLQQRQNENFPEDGYISEEIGEILFLLGREDEARPHFFHAFTLLSNDVWIQQNEKDRLMRLEQLSNGNPNSQKEEYE
ncbi:MAG: hypothetical protein ACK5C0_11850 [Candidatus Kapaibacterium sp.]|jgi:tetratricopeptide (TPR) repeat protein